MTPGERVDAAMLMVGARPAPLTGDDLMERATAEWIALDEALGLLRGNDHGTQQ